MACVSLGIANLMAQQQAALYNQAYNQLGNMLKQGQHREMTMEDDLFFHLQDWDKNYLLDEAMK